MSSHLSIEQGKSKDFLFKKKEEFMIIRRQNPEYQEALGQTLHNVIKNIPGGVLVFFPCYKMIEEVVTTWKVRLFDRKILYFSQKKIQLE